MPTVSELIHSSFRLIGAVVAGETLESHELDDGFVSLNQMMSSWNTEGTSVFGRTRVTLTVQQNVSTYVYPSSLGFPVRIEAASTSLGGVEHPLEIVDANGWEAIPERGMLALTTKKLWCDHQYPTANIHLWPIPRLGPGSLELIVYAQIAQFAELSQVINLPPGYEAALRYNLAVNLASEYGRPLEATVAALAQSFKASIVQMNAGNHLRSQIPAQSQDAMAKIAGQGVTQ